MELMRDYLMSGKGDDFKIYKLDWIPLYATEEFLCRNGYAEQITEIRTRKSHQPKKAIGLDSLTESQRERVIVLMNDRHYTEIEALHFVQEHQEDEEVAGDVYGR
jgi:hypothetical protein